ncbi:MAG: ATP-binding protein, partial [Chloroflexota bacterium]|nr:ATP-binding protein [Chloroflexota bacterium]
VSLLVTGALGYIVLSFPQGPLYNPDERMLGTVALLDLLIASTIGMANVLLGQAIVAYEIFTGKTLPRQGLAMQWRGAVVLAGGYSLLVGWGLAMPVHPVYLLLVATVLIALSYALFSWRSYRERERYMAHLRPFLQSGGLYRDLTAQPGGEHDPSPYAAVAGPFRALCRNVLGTQVAYLGALGPLSSLPPLRSYPPIAYPEEQKMEREQLEEIGAQIVAPSVDGVPILCMRVEPERSGGAEWAVPLWSERGLVGVMLLGPKRDGGLYTQEEIEIARASGERLIDAQAAAAMSQQLMLLQRTRMAESQVLDRQARRVLHDDVLPLLHTAMLKLSVRREVPAGDPTETLGITDGADAGFNMLQEAHGRISELLREMPWHEEVPHLSKIGLIEALRRTAEGEFAEEFSQVEWCCDPGVVDMVAEIPALPAEVLFYAAREAIRNAARYGRGSDAGRPLTLRIKVELTGGLRVTVEDDGEGIAPGEPLLEREEGVAGNGRAHAAGRDSRTSMQSSGQGLALHSTLMAVVGGSLAVESRVAQGLHGRSGTRVVLSMPVESALQL